MGEVQNTVASGLCLGCGLCASHIGEGKVEMRLSGSGFLRPIEKKPLSAAANKKFLAICPARNLSLRPDPAAEVNRVWGPLVRVRTAWATDGEVRFKGSSGGGISAICIHLLEEGQIDFVAQIAVDKQRPLINRIQRSRTREDILHAAGSRYAPAAPLENIEQLFEGGEKFAFVGKPCDVGAMRSYLREHPQSAHQVVALLSFMCAGVPSMRGTEEVLSALGTTASDVSSFQYRGNGWPGYATAVTHDGRTLEMDYNSSWGNILGKHLQLRCKLCPDGTGEFADIVCADAWHGKDGYPDFAERDGRSLLLTRSRQGERIVQSAADAKSLQLEDLPVEDIAGMQPYQKNRKEVVFGRWLGYSARRGLFPRFSQLRLIRNLLSGGITPALKNAWGTARRLRGGHED